MRVQLVPLLGELRRRFPELADVAEEAIRAGTVLVNGAVMSNPAARVARDSSIVVHEDRQLRGFAKLMAAIELLDVAVAGRTALDVGASAGGFTKALLHCGASRVYAVDVGHGQLVGSLRQDARVVNLEGMNVSQLGPAAFTEGVDLVTIDVSYLSLAAAVGQIPRAWLAAGAELLGLVKPMFELALGQLPTARPDLDAALRLGTAGVEVAGWEVLRTIESPTLGSKGAIEFFVHARLP